VNRDERIDLARWLWDVGMSGRCREPKVAIDLGIAVMDKLALDLRKKAREEGENPTNLGCC
jgi:hypothetical protein